VPVENDETGFVFVEVDSADSRHSGTDGSGCGGRQRGREYRMTTCNLPPRQSR
jgi:hypothetical protein